MKLHISKIMILAFICLLYTHAISQKLDTAVSAKNWVLAGGEWVDTTKVTPQQKAIINRTVLAQKLTEDHYFYPRNLGLIGVRFTGGSGKKSEIYRGSTGEKSIIIDGNCNVEFAALDITPENAGDFRYHVVENERKELVSWTKPAVFKKTADGKRVYAYLGKFDYAKGRVLKIEVYNINNYRYSDVAYIDWSRIKAPKLTGYVQYFSSQIQTIDGSLFAKDLTALQQTEELYYKKGDRKNFSVRPTTVKDFIETTDRNDIRLRADDSVKTIVFQASNRNYSSNYRVKLTRPTENGTETIWLTETNSRVDIIKDIWQRPGKYTITFVPWLVKHGGRPVHLFDSLATSISFTVLPPEKKYMPVKTVVAIILTLITAAVINFTLFRNRQKRKLEKEAQNRQIATLQLQSVRAQLNPHFIFNALAGIQNLINKNAIEDANKYLSRFARLTRNVLDDAQKDLISIEKETELLDDYLQMEQTRFGFNYSIKVDEQIDQQIEIPAMLLQPFVENAVKHGISALKENGRVDVSITQNNTDIALRVVDNGSGFKGEPENGKGIKLCRERIALFNSIHKNTLILLKIDQANTGTVVTIELKNWL